MLEQAPRAPIRAARGPELRCRGWRQETILRLLENTLELAERPDDLVVYAAHAKAARDWDSYGRIVRVLESLADGETLVVQSGKPVGVFPTGAALAGRCDGQRQPGWPLRDAGALLRAGARGASSRGAGSPPGPGSTSAPRA